MRPGKKFYYEVPDISRKNDAIEFVNEIKKYGFEINGTGGPQWFTENYEGWLEQYLWRVKDG